MNQGIFFFPAFLNSFALKLLRNGRREVMNMFVVGDRLVCVTYRHTPCTLG